MMTLRYGLKHVAHCALLFSSLFFCMTFLITVTTLKTGEHDKFYGFNPWHEYGNLGCSLLFGLRLLVLLALPQVLLNFVGLTAFDAFPGPVALAGSSLLTPLVCVRIVTRGDYPALVRENVARNMAQCLEAGLENFLIEVVTDKPIGLPRHRRIRELVVPAAYRPKSGALYKARALQYCLEDEVNELADNDYIVHLDEETLMTRNSVRGILNFMLEGKHDFGQGLITYAGDRVMNWLTTLADSNRVADDMGKLRAQFNFFGKPILSWKGSYIVAKVYAERRVSFDHGIQGSLAEDCYFAMKAYMEGYTFAFVDGEMWEKSPFTLRDFVQQRKRWVQGLTLVVHSPEIAWRYKIWLALTLYAWVTMPLSLSNIVLGILFPLPTPLWLNFLCSFIATVNIYMFFFGAIKSLPVYRLGALKYGLCIASLPFVIVLSTLMENVAIITGVFARKNKFYIVDKNMSALKTDIQVLKV